MDQPDQAEPVIEGLLSHPELSPTDFMNLTVHLAECRYQQIRYDEGLELLRPLISKLESDNYHDAHLMAQIRNQMGKAHCMKRDFTNALYNFRKAFDYTERFVTFDSLTANIAYNVGITLGRVGNQSEAIPYFERSQEYYKSAKDLQSLADSIFDQGVSYKNNQDYTRAAECFDQARSLYAGLNERRLSYRVQLVMASLTMRTDFDQALQQLQECIPVFQEGNDHKGLVVAQARTAYTYIQLGNFEMAYVHLQEGLDVLRKNSDLNLAPESAELHKILSTYHFALGQYKEAVEIASQAADIFASVGLVKDQVEALQVAVESHEALCQALRDKQHAIQAQDGAQ